MTNVAYLLNGSPIEEPGRPSSRFIDFDDDDSDKTRSPAHIAAVVGRLIGADASILVNAGQLE